jgi:hypothetical protein
LPPLDGPRGATQGDPVLVLAGDESVRADIGTIDKMLPRRQVFRAEGLMDGGRALGFIDGSGGRVHVREQVGRGRLARLADMHHVPGPLRVAFVAVPCLRIIGGFDPFRRGRQLAIGLEADAGDGRLACGGPLARGWGFLHIPPKRYISASYSERWRDWDLRQRLHNRIDVDGFRCLAELITPVEVDVLPGHRRDLLEQGDSLRVTGSSLASQYVR